MPGVTNSSCRAQRRRLCPAKGPIKVARVQPSTVVRQPPARAATQALAHAAARWRVQPAGTKKMPPLDAPPPGLGGRVTADCESSLLGRATISPLSLSLCRSGGGPQVSLRVQKGRVKRRLEGRGLPHSHTHAHAIGAAPRSGKRQARGVGGITCRPGPNFGWVDTAQHALLRCT
eukprot:282809-Chlamydomonas_euryale.AAC.2